MEKVNLGRVSMVPRGVYDPEVTYERLDLVTYEGNGYLVLRSVTGVTPANGEDYMLYSYGVEGPEGKPGPAGSSPVVTVQRNSTDTGVVITVTDAEGTKSVEVFDGKGSSITVDDALSATSTNPVQNKVIQSALSGKLDADKLDKAVDDALAQAKESGEFDGEPGEPGKDGAGLNVTGAAVGQIARISAVDENGVPTAWEPVDMPSGAEGLNTLAEVQIAAGTIAQDTSAGKIDTGITVGDLRQYKMFAFRIRSAGTSTSLSGLTGFGTKGTHWNDNIYFNACACALFVISWLDVKKTQGKCEMAYTHTYGTNAGEIGDSLLNIALYDGVLPNSSLHNTCFCYFGETDDAPIYITLNNAAPGEVLWEVRGIG